MDDVRSMILGARSALQECIMKGFEPVAPDNAEEVSKAEEGNIFERYADALEKAQDTDAEKALEGEIEKSDIMEALSGYGSDIRFGKLGKEIKGKLKELLPNLTAKLQVASAEADSLLAQCDGAPDEDVPIWWTGEIKMDVPYRIFSWKARDCSERPALLDTAVGAEPGTTLTAEVCQCRDKYNEKVRAIANIMTDIKAIEIMNNNLGDNDRYQLTPRQLTTLGF